MKKSDNKEKQQSTSKLLKCISILYGIIFVIVLFLLFFISGVDYHLKRRFILSNIISIIPIIGIFILFYKTIKKEDISDTKYKKILALIFVLTAIIQIILILNIYFYTDWDVKVVRGLVNKYLSTGNLKDEFYLSIYPNNILLVGILALIKKIPFIGNYYITTLIFNSQCVNIAGMLTSLTIKNMHSKKAGLLCYLVMAPLTLLSPWIVIPYTDTIALLFTSMLIYLYTKNNRKKIDYFFIGLVSMLGYYIKPTVIIILIAIAIVEGILIINKKFFTIIKDRIKIIGIFIIGVFFAVLVNNSAKIFLKFEPVTYIRPFSFVHYLAMGQNNDTLGAYSQSDVDDTINIGQKNDIYKFKDRLLNRSFKQQIVFFTKKTLLNFNDGSFCWGLDGTFFYKKTKPKNGFSRFLRQIYYGDGKYFDWFIQIQNYIWLTVLFFMPWIIKKENNKKEYVLMLSIIGLILFLTIFEPRTRYMYCYSNIYIIVAILGIYNLKELIASKKGTQLKKIKKIKK